MTSHTDLEILEHVKAHVNYLLENSPIYGHLLSTLQVTLATTDRVLIRLVLEPRHLNSKNILHGAVTATLVDFMGSLAIVTHDCREKTGVSADMHISYVGSAKLGDVLEAEGLAVKVGGSLAFTTITLRKVAGVPGGEASVVAIGSHTKYVRLKV